MANELIHCSAGDIVGGDRLAISHHDPDTAIEVLEVKPDESNNGYIKIHLKGRYCVRVLRSQKVYRQRLEGEI